MRKLGSGSFGEIFLALDLGTGEEVAVKLEPINVSLRNLMLSNQLIMTKLFSHIIHNCTMKAKSTSYSKALLAFHVFVNISFKAITIA